jgi:hypothetical protein
MNRFGKDFLLSESFLPLKYELLTVFAGKVFQAQYYFLMEVSDILDGLVGLMAAVESVLCRLQKLFHEPFQFPLDVRESWIGFILLRQGVNYESPSLRLASATNSATP